MVTSMGSREELQRQGFTVARGVLAPPLVARLLVACTEAKAIARAEISPQAQRLQPVVWRDDLPQDAFAEYARWPPMREAVARIFSPQHRHCNTWHANAPLGCLFEPAQEPWCTNWHRDWRDNYFADEQSRLDADGPRAHMLEAWSRGFDAEELFCQINLALLPESSLWVVPGSSTRREDTPEETARFPDQSQPIPTPDLQGLSNAERLAACEDYARSMPGAVQLHLEPGDCCFYRNTLWHCGVYDPAKPRATLHDIVDTAEYCAYRSAMDELGGGPRGVPERARQAYEQRAWPWGDGEASAKGAAARL
jgi:hypothetical protein